MYTYYNEIDFLCSRTRYRWRVKVIDLRVGSKVVEHEVLVKDRQDFGRHSAWKHMESSDDSGNASSASGYTN